jgi:hypothetical protein
MFFRCDKKKDKNHEFLQIWGKRHPLPTKMPQKSAPQEKTVKKS